MPRTPGAAAMRLFPVLFTVSIIAACTPVATTPSPPPASPGPSTRLPTPVPTAPATPGPTPTDAPAAPTGLVARLTTCSHTCGPTPGTTVLADGRIIWEDVENRATESRLTPEALELVTEALAIPELETDGDFQAELRPGAEPIGRGATLYRLEVLRDDRGVVVTFGDPTSYADEPDLWIIPAEMTALAEIARRLRDPVAWLGPEAFTEGPRRFDADRFLVLVDLFPQVGEDPNLRADIDDVEWPMGAPIEGIGVPVEAAGGFGTRCLVITAEIAEAMIAAEEAAGAIRQQRLWVSTVEYRWKRADGFVQVSMLPVLPHEHGSCADLAAQLP